MNNDVDFTLDSGKLNLLLDSVKPEDKLPDGRIKRNSHSSYVGEVTENGMTHSVFYQPGLCYVKKSNIHEHGVFAARPFAVGEVIEEVKTIILDTTEQTLNNWVIARYGIKWDCDCDICKVNGKTFYFPTGNGMLYNHSNDPNVQFILNKPLKKVTVVALKSIGKDEELTRHYGVDYNEMITKMITMYPRPDLPENKSGYMIQKKVESCAYVPNDIGPTFRSMIVPERIVE